MHCVKYGQEKSQYLDTFHEVMLWLFQVFWATTVFTLNIDFLITFMRQWGAEDKALRKLLGFTPKRTLRPSIFASIIDLMLQEPTQKWSNTLKQFVGNSRRIVWVCLSILWGWILKGLHPANTSFNTYRMLLLIVPKQSSRRVL